MRILVTGASGQLGAYVIDELAQASVKVAAWSGSRSGSQGGIALETVDLGQVDRVAAAFRDVRPDIVIHAAALSSIADCYRDPERARSVNVLGTHALCELSVRANSRFVYVSTDLVFGGDKGDYCEADAPSPLSVYGRTKADAELAVMELAGAVMVRLSLLYGPTRIARPSFFDQQVAAIKGGERLSLFEDEWRSPLDLATAARALVAVARSDYMGILHIGGPQRMSRLELGQRVARCLGLNSESIVAATRTSAPFPEPRPRDCSLDSTRWRERFPSQPWPHLEQAIGEMFALHH